MNMNIVYSKNVNKNKLNVGVGLSNLIKIQSLIFLKLSSVEVSAVIKKILFRYTFKFFLPYQSSFNDKLNYNSLPPVPLTENIYEYNLNTLLMFKVMPSALKTDVPRIFKSRFIQRIKSKLQGIMSKRVFSKKSNLYGVSLIDVFCFTVSSIKVVFYHKDVSYRFYRYLQSRVNLQLHFIFQKIFNFIKNRSRVLLNVLSILLPYQKHFILRKNIFLIKRLKLNLLRKNNLKFTISTLSKSLADKYIYIEGIGLLKMN